jgi:hypothetical protein
MKIGNEGRCIKIVVLMKGLEDDELDEDGYCGRMWGVL